MEGNIEFVTLAPGDDVIATAEHEKFAYFKIIVSDNSDMLTLRADPANDESDPDIYVSNHSKEVGQDKYTWKSTNVGADRLDIHPEDEKYVIGEYYMAVFAYRPGLNTFRIRCDVTPCPSYTILEDKEEFTGMLKEHDTAYHRAKIMNAGESRIEVTVTPGKHVTAVFASSNVLYPSLDEHQWSVGIYDLDPAYTRSNRVAEAIVDVDPFDNFM